MIAFPYGMTLEQTFSVLQGHVISLTRLSPGLWETSRYEIAVFPKGCMITKHVWRFKPDSDGWESFLTDAAAFERMCNVDYPPGELMKK
jgi:hypothetical protein